MTNSKPLIKVSNSQLGKYCQEFNCKTAEVIDLEHLKIWLKEHKPEIELNHDKS